jgi:hypothetical protein
MFPVCASEDLAIVRILRRLSCKIVRTDIHPKLNKLGTAYDPIANACILVHTRTGLLNSIGILVVDTTLLFAMLIGLLRYPQGKSANLLKFLYQQVMLVSFFLVYTR